MKNTHASAEHYMLISVMISGNKLNVLDTVVKNEGKDRFCCQKSGQCLLKSVIVNAN